MRAIYILCEGQTEEEFVISCLRPYLNDFGIFDVRPILMSTSKTSKGGDVKFGRLKHNAERILASEHDIIVTTFIDFFRIKSDFPGYSDAYLIRDKFTRVAILEEKMRQNINNERFIPYIQLHEFEGLFFASPAGFEYLSIIPHKNMERLYEAVREHDNPELLNDGEDTAPSKRLQLLIPGYKKILYGSMIAQEVSVATMLERCTRFHHWINLLISRLGRRNDTTI